MPKLIALAPYPNRSADTRYRILQFAPYLEKANWQLTIRPFMNDRLYSIYNAPGQTTEKVKLTVERLISRLHDLSLAHAYDAALLHKEAFPFGPPFLEKGFRNRIPTLIYDMDDAYWTHPPQFKQIGRRLRDPKRIEKIIEMSDCVLAGNEFLADFARIKNPKVAIFPTVIDTMRYLPRTEFNDGKVTIGWVGRWSSEAYLNFLIPVFEKLVRKNANIEIKFIGASPDTFSANLPVKTIPWSLETEIDDIAGLDIGIMPLPDDEYSRGKCGFKLLQYMALGIPSIASPIGVNTQIIKDGQNGYLASNSEEWVMKLDLLIADKTKRSEIGINGRVTVEENFSLQKAAPILVSILNEFV